MTGDDDPRMLSWSSLLSTGGFSSGEAFPSKLVLRSYPVMLPLSYSLLGDSSGGVAGGTRSGVGSRVSDADIFASFAPVLAECDLVGVESGLCFELCLALSSHVAPV